MMYQTIHQLQYLGPLDTFDEQSDLLYEALLSMHGVTDPDMAATMSDGTIEVTMIVEASDFDDAVKKSMCDLRTAIHSIGGSTPGWETIIRELSHGAREVVA